MSDPAPGIEQVKEEIAKGIAAVHDDSYGEGVHGMEVAVEENMISIVMGVVLSPAEKTLIDAGNADAVRETREAYQQAIAATFIAVVERASGRRVSSFASSMITDAATPWSVETFRLEPHGS